MQRFPGVFIFVFGDATGSFYDDGNDATDGTEDYALIWDFEDGIDHIQLHGAIDDYRMDAAPAGLPGGTAIYQVNTLGPDELIAIVGPSLVDLTDDMIFV